MLVNPNSISQMDAAIDRALDMPTDEQRARMQRLDAIVCQRDIGHWTRHMLAAFDTLRRPQGDKAKTA